MNLSYLPLGNRKFPRQPRGILHRLFRDAGLNNSDEVFDEILRVNALRFIKLLKALEPYEGAIEAEISIPQHTHLRTTCDAVRLSVRRNQQPVVLCDGTSVKWPSGWTRQRAASWRKHHGLEKPKRRSKVR